ncbi:Hypothetical predicted protein, partial [Marmota monax]
MTPGEHTDTIEHDKLDGESGNTVLGRALCCQLSRRGSRQAQPEAWEPSPPEPSGPSEAGNTLSQAQEA